MVKCSKNSASKTNAYFSNKEGDKKAISKRVIWFV